MEGRLLRKESIRKSTIASFTSTIGDLDAVVGVDETTRFLNKRARVEKRSTETYFHSINSMVMMNELAIEDKPHRSDEPNFRTRESSEIPQSSVQVQTPLGIRHVRDGKSAR